MTLTRRQLVDILFEKIGLNKREATDMVDTFFEQARLALEKGESVKLAGFGKFQLRDKRQRSGRNPRNGEKVPITARRVVTFHASRKLKAKVARGDEAQQLNLGRLRAAADTSEAIPDRRLSERAADVALAALEMKRRH